MTSVLYTPGRAHTVEEVASGAMRSMPRFSRMSPAASMSFRFNESVESERHKLDLPAGGSPGIVSANDSGREAYFAFESFLDPATLYARRRQRASRMPIKSLPARFDASGLVTEQF